MINVKERAWHRPSRPDEIKPIPWLAPIVIQYLDEIINPDFEVLEHGSGGSTLWLAQRCKHVTSCEGDKDWYEKLNRIKPDNVELIGSNRVPVQYNYDLVLIDGDLKHRANWCVIAATLIKRGGWIVLDNANRPEYNLERTYLQSICQSFETFDGNEENTKYLVTEFYRMK